LLKALEALEHNCFPRVTTLGEPQLGRRGLYSTLSNTEINTINVVSTDGFPTTGTAVVQASGNVHVPIEYIGYIGKTATTLTGLTRAKQDLAGPLGLSGGAGTSTAATFTLSATAPHSVTFFSPQCSNTISHWGSSVMMDGRFDNDKGLVFVAGPKVPNRCISQLAINPPTRANTYTPTQTQKI
jgi:hypothetical protein